MKCNDIENLIQDRLDGIQTETSQPIEEHLQHCSACRDLLRAVSVLETGLAAMPAPILPSTLAANVATVVLSERRHVQRQRRRWAGILAVAAGLLLIFGIDALLPENSGTNEGGGARLASVKESVEPEPTLEEQANEVQIAVLEQARRKAEETVDLTSKLIPKIQMALPEELRFPDISPQAQGLKRASAKVTDGFEPVTKSAVRAWNLIRRDIATFGKDQSGL